MSLAVQLEPVAGAPPDVQYRWDADTDILTATLGLGSPREGVSGSVELEGTDGSWLILDVSRGCIAGLEVAVWPDVHRRATLTAPRADQVARVIVPAIAPDDAPRSLEVETPLTAEADDGEHLIYFRIGARREARTVRVGRDLLFDLDRTSHVAGLWLLNVPPFPSN